MSPPYQESCSHIKGTGKFFISFKIAKSICKAEYSCSHGHISYSKTYLENLRSALGKMLQQLQFIIHINRDNVLELLTDAIEKII